MSWKKVKLGDILEESKIESYKSDPDKRITVRLNFKGVEKRPFEKGVEGGTKYYVRKAGQFIYGKQNLFKGAFGLVPEKLDGFETSQDIPTFDIHKSCSPDWLIYFFRQGNFYQSLEGLATGTGSRRIQPTRLFEVEMPLPNLLEQLELIAKIHEIEKKYESLDGELNQQQTYIQLLRQTILQEAVQGKLTKQDPTDEPATELLKRIKAEKEKLIKAGKLKKEKELPPITEDEIPFELPEGWACCRLTDIAGVGTGATPLTTNKDYYKGNVPWITSSATGSLFVSEAEKFISEKAIKETNCKVYPIGTLIVAMYGQGKTRGQITELLVEAATNQACAAIELIIKDDSHKNYIKYFFRKIYLEIRELAEGGAQPNLNLQKIKDTLIPLPPLPEQQRIVAKVQQLQQQLSQLESQVQQSRQHAQQLLQSVLKEAFEQKGKVYEMEEEVSMVAEE